MGAQQLVLLLLAKYRQSLNNPKHHGLQTLLVCRREAESFRQILQFPGAVTNKRSRPRKHRKSKKGTKFHMLAVIRGDTGLPLCIKGERISQQIQPMTVNACVTTAKLLVSRCPSFQTRWRLISAPPRKSDVVSSESHTSKDNRPLAYKSNGNVNCSAACTMT